MYTQAKVLEVLKDGTVRLGCDTNACQGCKAELFCNNKGVTDYLARNDNKLEVKAGDMVQIYLPPAKTIGSTALVFALPLALFPLGYLLLHNVLGASEILSAGGGFAAMGLAFSIAAFVNIKHKRGLMPVITKIVSGEN